MKLRVLRHAGGMIAAIMLAACTCGNSVSSDEAPVTPPAAEAAAAPEPEPVAGPAPVVGGPALWKTEDEDTTIYIFGTVHVLPRDVRWRTEAFDSAFVAADTVYFEADVDKNDPELALLVTQLGSMPLGESLYDLLTDEDEARLIAAAADVGLSAEPIGRLKPWFVGMILSMQNIIASGHDPESGVESVLQPEARDAGKTLRYFETAEQQLRFMADLPMEAQIDFLMDGVRQIKDIPDFIAKLDDAWVAGDVDALETLILEDESMKGPEIYGAMLVNRNRNWSATLRRLLAEEQGVFFVAVGAAHLAGEDSVIAMLADKGVTTVRVQ